MEGIRKASLLLSLAVPVLVATSVSPAGELPWRAAEASAFFQVRPHHNSAGGDREIQAMAAEWIGRQAERDRTVPDGRVRHFSWIKRPILRWSGEILDQAVLPSGLRVRVRVYPVLEGGLCAVGSHLDETYLIQDGVARLTTIEYGDPKGPRVLTFN
jgi:hypothetical protein